MIAGVKEHGEKYLCEVIDAAGRGHEPTPDPVVRVLAVIRYPDQRAILWPDVATEVPPLTAGCVCRLPILEDDPSAFEGGLDADSALAAALEKAIREAATCAERKILLRHAAGETRGGRAVKTLRPWEI